MERRRVMSWSPPPSVRWGSAVAHPRVDRADTKPAADAQRVTPENALRSKDHHQDDDAAPDLPAPIRQELERGGKVRDDERAEQGTVQHVHTSEHHVHRDVDRSEEHTSELQS